MTELEDALHASHDTAIRLDEVYYQMLSTYLIFLSIHSCVCLITCGALVASHLLGLKQLSSANLNLVKTPLTQATIGL
jgi:hypothetical protein